MPAGKIVNEIGFTLLLPLALGMLYLYLYPRAAVSVSKWCIRASLLGIVLIVIGSISAGRLNLAVFGMNNVMLVVLFTLVLTVTGLVVPPTGAIDVGTILIADDVGGGHCIDL